MNGRTHTTNEYRDADKERAFEMKELSAVYAIQSISNLLTVPIANQYIIHVHMLHQKVIIIQVEIDLQIGLEMLEMRQAGLWIHCIVI